MMGWECPKCGRCYAPHVSQCVVCPLQATVSIGTSTVVCTCGQTGQCPVHRHPWSTTFCASDVRSLDVDAGGSGRSVAMSSTPGDLTGDDRGKGFSDVS